MTIKINSIISFIENKICDTSRYYEWDNNGLQIDSQKDVLDKVALSLDPTEQSIKSAINKGCGLLITHHPLFFGSVKSISFSSPIGRKIMMAIKNDLAIYSYHTSMDLADYSLNDFLAEQLGFKPISNLEDTGVVPYYKFVVFVPKGYENRIVELFESAGAGSIGNYTNCSFYTEGIGTFKPMDGTNPFIGKIGILEEVNEYRVETIVPKKNLNKLISMVKSVHPYEEVAYDIYPLELCKKYGLGRIVSLNNTFKVSEILDIIRYKLCENIIRYNGLDDMIVDKAAIVTGSGASYWKLCKSMGVKLLITGDLKHHDALDAKENGIAIIDVGHFETEKIFMNYLGGLIKKEFGIDVEMIDEDKSIKTFYLKEDINDRTN
jgi:dinuclear metal center YbgI/SA1388 family protein